MRSTPSASTHSPSKSGLGSHGVAQRIPRHLAVFLERGHGQARRPVNAVKISPSPWLKMMVFGAASVPEPGVGVLLDEHGALGLEVGILDDQQTVGPRVAHRPQHRMALPHEQPTAGPQQAGDDARPTRGCRAASTDGADARVDDVDALRTERVHRVVDDPPRRTARRHLRAAPVHAPPPTPPGRSPARSSTARRAGPATPCRCRCGTAGARRRGRRADPAAAGRSEPPARGTRGRRSSPGRSRRVRCASAPATPSWPG